MASNIDSSKPAEGAATTASVRDNFATAKSEISGLQFAATAFVEHTNDDAIHAPLPASPTPEELVLGTATQPRTFSPDNVREMIANFAGGADPAPDLGLITSGSVSASELYDGGLCCLFAHFDDGVLWMLPALYYAAQVAGVGQPFTDDKYRVLDTFPSWLGPRYKVAVGSSNDTDWYAFWVDPDARVDYYQDVILRAAIRDVMKRSGCSNFMSHNPWGEYGHLHHRMISAQVEAVAVELGASYWYLNMFIPEDGGNPGDEYTELSTACDYVNGDFNQSEFLPLRQLFLDIDGDPGTTIPTWTWHLPDTSFPEGTRKIVRRVNAGVTDTADQTQINSISSTLPVFGGPTP